MTDIPAVGAHCALPTCNVIDFLPIKCECTQLFCRDHISPETHSCSVTARTVDMSAHTSGSLQRCALKTCTRPSLESFLSASTRADSTGRSPALCDGCNNAFCAEHRERSAHACVPVPPKDGLSKMKNAKAHALLEKHFSKTLPTSSSSSTKSARSYHPRKVTQSEQVRLIKMRHAAKPGDPRDTIRSIGFDQRLHLQVSKENDDAPTPIWFRKNIITGRAVDLLASYLNMTLNKPLCLVKVTDNGNRLLDNSLALIDQVEDGSFVSIVYTTKVV